MQRGCLCFAGAVALLMVMGCVDGAAEDDQAPPPPRGVLSVTVDGEPGTNGLDFGDVGMPDEVARLVRLANTGDGTLVIDDVGLDDSTALSLDNLADMPPLLAPGESWDVVVRFRPEFDMSLTTRMRVSSNSGPPVDVPLWGEGLAPRIEVEAPETDFGNVALGCAETREVVVSNRGRQPLGLSAELSESLDPELVGVGVGAVLLEPDDHHTLSLTFVPQDLGPYDTTLSLLSSDPQTPRIDLTFSGAGWLDTSESEVDEWVQDGNFAVDVLFVIDTSASMAGERLALEAAIDPYHELLDSTGIDYQIGVLTAAVSDDGLLQGAVPIVTPTTPDPAGTVQSNMAGLPTGGGNSPPHLFDSAYLALSSPNTDPGGSNEPFLRPGAALNVLFITNGSEASTLLASGDPNAYASYFRGLKEDPDRVRLANLSGGLTGCTGPHGMASTATDLVQSSAITGGISMEVCANPYDLLAFGWLAAADPPDLFILSRTPVEDTLSVEISTDGGVTFAPAVTGWSYDPLRQAIAFAPGSVPEDDEIVRATYFVSGLCE